MGSRISFLFVFVFFFFLRGFLGSGVGVWGHLGRVFSSFGQVAALKLEMRTAPNLLILASTSDVSITVFRV